MRQFFYRFTALIFLILFLPILIILFFLVKFSSKGPFIFKQKRMGKNGKIFTLYKIRTMVDNAEKIKPKFLKRNESDGPAFKIYEDPRYTKIGRFLSHIGIDELPQLINVILGNMSFVGPRPLPVNEALQVPKKYSARFSILPGMTSTWILEGAHKLTFEQWMNLDLDYVKNNDTFLDIGILIKTLLLIPILFIKNCLSLNKN